MARKIILSVGVVLLLIGGLVWWRATHPPLTDEQQIEANLDGIKSSIEACSADRVMNYTSEDFTLNSYKRSEVRSQLTGFCLSRGLRKPDFKLELTNIHITVKGATATATGHYSVYTRTFKGAVKPTPGEFSTDWEKQNGQWKVTHAGGDMPSPDVF